MVQNPVRAITVGSPTSADYNAKDGSALGFYNADQLSNTRNRACISVSR